MKRAQSTFAHSNYEGLLVFVLIIADIIIYNGSLVLAYWLRWSTYIGNAPSYYFLFGVINVFFLVSAALTGLYRGIRNVPLNNQRFNLRRFTYYLALFIMSYLFLIKGFELSRGVILTFIFVQYVALDAFHHLFAKLKNALVRRGIGTKNTIIVGADASALEFYNSLHKNFQDDYQVRGFIKNGYPKHPPQQIMEKIIGGYGDVASILDELGIDRVFIVSDSMLKDKYVPIQQACESRRIKLKMVSPQTLSLIKSAKIKDITGVPLTTDAHRTKVYQLKAAAKRVTDILLSSLAIILASPFLLVIATLVKFTSRGPVIFKQKRSTHKSGSVFDFYKFRTMYVDAEERKKELEHLNETNGALFKMKDDPRITKVGKWLRRYSLDELPQLFNVLKGDMSVVGPRPLPFSDFEKVEQSSVNYDWYEKRGDTKPGITGLWQISGRSNLSFEEMVMLDLYYIENQSLFFDLEIMFETIPIVLTAKGAY